MSYASRNPRFDSVIYSDSVIASAPNPAAGSHKLLIDSTGNLFVKDSAGVSVQVAGIGTINGETGISQSFATSTLGTDFTITSSLNVHTFNIPDASAGSRGVITTGAQTLAGLKTFSGGISGAHSAGSVAGSIVTTGINAANVTTGTMSGDRISGGTANTSLIMPTTGGTAGTLDYYEQSFTKAVDGDLLGGGNVIITRTGNAVCIRGSGVIAHNGGAALSVAETSNGFLPDRFRPGVTVHTLYGLLSNNSLRVDVESGGRISFSYFDGGGNANTRTSTQLNFCISYPI